MTFLVQHSAHEGSSHRRNVVTGHLICMICPYSIARLSQWEEGDLYLPMVIYYLPSRLPEEGEGGDSIPGKVLDYRYKFTFPNKVTVPVHCTRKTKNLKQFIGE
jgi:hypothetical protein